MRAFNRNEPPMHADERRSKSTDIGLLDLSPWYWSYRLYRRVSACIGGSIGFFAAECLMAETRKVSVSVNGQRYEREVEVRLTLADFLRHELGLTGTHLGCEHGVCGRVHGAVRRSFRALVPDARVQANGHELLTVEGIAPSPDRLHPLQEAFRDNHGLQCGFCTPGILTTLIEFLARQSRPDRTGSAHRGCPAIFAAAPATKASSRRRSTPPSAWQAAKPR